MSMGELPASEVVTDIHGAHLYRDVGLPMWVLYDHPTDMPDHFVLRLWDGMTNMPTKYIFPAPSLEGIDAQCQSIPGRFYLMERFEDDDPKIMGVYL